MGVLLYSNILHAPFVFDDYSSVVDNDVIKNLKTSSRDISNNRYIAYLTFAMNYAIGDLKPFGYHLVNILIHVINAIFVYCLVVLTFRTPYFSSLNLPVHPFTHSPHFIAFSSAFIFVCHPIQTQAVTYIAQRATSMATMFYLLSLIMYIKWRLINQNTEHRAQNTEKKANKIFHLKSVFWYVGSVTSAVLAMKTKEIAFTLPFIAVLYEFCFFSKTSNLKRFFYLFPILLTMLIIPLSLLSIEGPAKNIVQDIDIRSRESVNINRADYLITQFRVIVTYLRLLIFPVNQSLDYSYPVYRSLLTPQVLLSLLFLLSIFGVAGYLLYRSRFTAHGLQFFNSRLSPIALRITAFGAFWFFITLSVESSIIPIKDIIVEHRLYLPSIGFFIASISFIGYLLPRTRARIVLMVVIVALLSAGTYIRNITWKDPQTLWEDVLAKFPNNIKAHNGLGVIFKNEGEYDKAVEQFKKALKINRNYAPIYYNLGDIQYRLGKYENAIAYFKKALELKSGYHLHLDILTSLAITYSEMGDNDNAVSTFKEAVRLFPSSVIPYNNLGRQYIKMGDFDSAIDILEKGLKIREEPHLRSNLSFAYAKKMERNKNAGKTKK